MTGVVLTGHGGPENLVWRDDLPVPMVGADDVLVRVNAAGVNNTDINTRLAWYSKGDAEASDASWSGIPVTFPRIQGADVCGNIVAVGSGVDPARIGERVLIEPCLQFANGCALSTPWYFGSECDGGFAQYVALPARNVSEVNSSWTDIELATISCSYSTAENMLLRARIAEGETVLITGASGGVGSALIQLAKLRNCIVIALSTAEKADTLKALGADAVIRRGHDEWVDVIKALTGTEKVDLVADVVGGPVFENVLGVMKRGARYVTAGAIGGKMVSLDISHLYLRDWDLIGSTVTGLETFPNVVRYIEEGRLNPLVAASYPLEKIVEAQEAFLTKQHVGNIVLEIPK